MWRDVQTVQTPDLPDAQAILKAADAPAQIALSCWRGQQDHADRSHVTTDNLPRSEYRLKRSKDGKSATVQMRELPRE